MNLNNITALKPHASYKKKYDVPKYPLFLSSRISVDKLGNIIRHNVNNHNLNNHNVNIQIEKHLNVNIQKENQILPTIKWDPTWCVPPESGIEESPEKIGFIILRNVNSVMTNEYWKECYTCIKRFYPKNRILIIDDNSDYKYVSNLLLDNTMIIRSEYPKRGEYLPYYYYLKTNFCETAVILHDSVFIKKYIDFNVSSYKILLDFGRENITDPSSMPYQKKILSEINSEKLNNFYNKKNSNLWKGCFGCMSAIKYDYLKHIDNEFRIACLIPHITCKDARCAFERIIGCLLQINIKENSFFGSIHKYCRWGLNYNEYLRHEYNEKLPLVKVWSGR
jgi:hypothetical protein